MIRCIVFDLDDTLYPEWSFIEQGFLSVSEKLYSDLCLDGKYTSKDIYEVLKNIYFNYSRVGIFNQLNRFIPEIEINEQYIVDELLPTYRFSKKILKCYPDVKPTLRKLHGKVKIGMVTNGNTQVQNYKIDLLGIRNYFDHIEVSGDYSEKEAKPSPFMLLRTLDVFRVKPCDVIYVGDNPETDRCSIDAGCHFLKIVRNNDFHKDRDRTVLPSYSIDNISELHHHIAQYKCESEVS